MAYFQGTWSEGVTCIEGGTDIVTLRPCCISNNGTCSITTSEFCEFYDGVWDTSKQKCGETNCFANRCGFVRLGSATTRLLHEGGGLHAGIASISMYGAPHIGRSTRGSRFGFF